MPTVKDLRDAITSSLTEISKGDTDAPTPSSLPADETDLKDVADLKSLTDDSVAKKRYFDRTAGPVLAGSGSFEEIIKLLTDLKDGISKISQQITSQD
jgi:hypothetical protein